MMPSCHSSFVRKRRRGARRNSFTLVEILVSLAILSIIMLLLLAMVSNISRMWTYSNSKMEIFRESRDAFEVMTRRIGQATLATYWTYSPPLSAYGMTPTGYVRMSDLQVVMGPTASLLGSGGTDPAHPGSAIFFQAPLGYDTTYLTSPTLLNLCGYYVEFNSDAAERPSFFSGPARYRYRLMQVLQPSSQLSIYNYTSGLTNSLGSPGYSYDGYNWFTSPLGSSSPPTKIMSENVLVLTMIPHLSTEDDPAETILPPSYFYDSRNPTNSVSLNQLPPLVDVTMVAVDETSANRLAQGASEPAYGTFISSHNLFQAATNNAGDLNSLETYLASQHVTYQVFSSTVSIEDAKWSIK
jgi:uncharacterized protein (TIGR02599 family)